MCFKNEDQVVYENNACLWDAIVVLIWTVFDTTKLEYGCDRIKWSGT